AEVDVAEEVAFRCLLVGRPWPELGGAADVVEKRGAEEQVGAQPWMQLRGLAAERRDAHRVLEKAAGVAVMSPRRRRKGTDRRAHLRVVDEGADGGRQAGVVQLAGQELEEPVQLVGVAAESGRELRGIRLGGRLERTDFELELVPEALDAAQDPD